jgi:hypothetical protein
MKKKDLHGACVTKKEAWERIRRLRAGELQRLFLHRWGPLLPDDQSGREDLWLLMLNASLATAEPEKKMNHVIDLWAPWMGDEERAGYVKHVWGLDLYQRIQTGREIGNLLRLTNAERVKLKLWQFKPIDATDEELEAQRKARRLENKRAKRRAKGVRPREVYLAELASKPKPWIAEGISRRTWERRHKAVSQGVVPTIVSKVEQDIATPILVERQQGCREGVLVEKLRIVPTETIESEANASSLPELETDPASGDENPRTVPRGAYRR